eukprot:CAMPEP_0185606280 /NCGR_PEP_ID=MMETSP0436-20130131/4653_1 /TAXON_ID=626734 ORGANISM="Favella taraikaensis, Strain Fe Narragansett Bay" /NCGR_SAMPLE_ID=MMETSP0436 /ASSEMBLY_ACC=CAM_ASM_000390 /LENGTH=191 /DNA_ID=CAMNT_0028237773 /DNA_START=505 /DNA_END=1080 /DNA_ORIENTATION=-
MTLQELDIDFATAAHPDFKLLVRADVEERVRHHLGNAASHRFDLGLRMHQASLQCDSCESESILVGDIVAQFLIEPSLRSTCLPSGISQIHWRGKSSYSAFDCDRLSFSIFMNLTLDLAHVFEGDALPDELLPDNSRQIKNHFGSCADAYAHEHAQEEVMVQARRPAFRRIQNELVLALHLVVGLVAAWQE